MPPSLGAASHAFCAVAVVLAAAALSSCHPDISDSELEAAVRARCAPVGDLLSKNIKASGRVRVAGVAGAGASYEENGAILSAAEAVQIANIDTACRAWVAGIMSDEAYGDVIAEQLAGAVSLTVPLDDQAARISAIATEMAAIRRSLPARYPSAAEIAADVGRLNAVPSAEILAPRPQEAGGSSEQSDDSLALIHARLDYLEQLMSDPAEQARSETGLGRSAVIPRSDGVDVYFSTASAELTFPALSEIQAKGRDWQAAGHSVAVVGFADVRGSPELNQRLSQQRADTVAEALASVGVNVASSRGAGVQETDRSSYSRARRVQVTILPSKE